MYKTIVPPETLIFFLWDVGQTQNACENTPAALHQTGASTDARELDAEPCNTEIASQRKRETARRNAQPDSQLSHSQEGRDLLTITDSPARKSDEW